MMHRIVFAAAGLAVTAGLAVSSPAEAATKPLRVVPSVYVGAAGDCGPVPGSRVVTARWLEGLGLPDDGTSENEDPAVAGNAHQGLILSKNSSTSNCSAAQAVVLGFGVGQPITQIGFDYRGGGHCGGGAPRFNIVSSAGYLYYLGCNRGAETAAPQDPEWRRVHWNYAEGNVDAIGSAPPFVFGVTVVKSIGIVFDEGNEATSPSDPTGAGLVIIDNINVNGKYVTKRYVP
jgi:hypothetical protein